MSAEIDAYREQLSLLDAQLSSCASSERANLEEMRNDLAELLALMQEEAGSTSTSVQAVDEDQEEGEEEEEDSGLNDLVGIRCQAPFPRARLPIDYHTAIIYEMHARAGVAMARVLYVHPLQPSMRPCQHFLAGTCRFDDKCKFSHGEDVAFDDLLEYREPDFGSLREGSPCLLTVEKELWEVGRVTAVDGEKGELAVRVLRTGQEVHAWREGVVPLEGEVEEKEQQEEQVHVPNDSWQELKGERNGKVAVGDLGDWQGGGFGLKLMQKMGYKLGEGLGRNSDGIVHAIQAVQAPKNKSVDYLMENKGKKRRVDGVERARGRVKTEMGKARGSVEESVFAFLNRRLAAPTVVDEKEEERREEKKVKAASKHELGKGTVDADSQMRELRSKERKLKEGIERNARDKRTVERLQTALAAVRRDMEKTEGRKRRLEREVKARSGNKDLF